MSSVSQHGAIDYMVANWQGSPEAIKESISETAKIKVQSKARQFSCSTREELFANQSQKDKLFWPSLKAVFTNIGNDQVEAHYTIKKYHNTRKTSGLESSGILKLECDKTGKIVNVNDIELERKKTTESFSKNQLKGADVVQNAALSCFASIWKGRADQAQDKFADDIIFSVLGKEGMKRDLFIKTLNELTAGILQSVSMEFAIDTDKKVLTAKVAQILISKDTYVQRETKEEWHLTYSEQNEKVVFTRYDIKQLSLNEKPLTDAETASLGLPALSKGWFASIRSWMPF